MDARCDQTFEFQIVRPRQPEPRRNVEQDAAFLGVDSAVGGGRLNLDFHEHADEVGGATALEPELVEHIVKGELRQLALVEKGAGGGALTPIETELIHHLVGEIDLLRRHPSVGLRDVPHDAEYSGEKSELDALRARSPGFLGANPAKGSAEAATHRGA